ncbi:hypothetical protein KRX52_11815 [Pseudomonas sp. MAP12]|uniref:Transmembrane protein n=1 Tax=Geopseudomonas aromaticivorans TaxID=2849492 RepID=A0ABS6MXE4_9GAMM|nr:hypothetical protein [Pseudomonas aromaticivorans]MBV2133476.1 hypothetical protein [Pseudomonas aromaticivorans]
MDEFNPYAPPRSRDPAPLDPTAAPPGFAAYRWLNWLYAGVMLVALLILLGGGTLRAEFSHLLVVAIFLAPSLSFALVLARREAWFRRWYWVQGLGSAVLLLFCFLDITGGHGLRGIGVFMTAVNAAALFAGEHFLRVRGTPGLPAENPQRHA